MLLNKWLIAVLIALTLFGFFYLDKRIVAYIGRFRSQSRPLTHHFFRLVSFTPFVVLTLYVIPTIFVFIYLDFFSAAALTLACFLATGLSFVGKYLFNRVRPLGHTTYLGKVDSAFPSAHTAGSFVAAFTLAFFWPAWSIPFFILASLVAVSRIYLELHFFSDVTGGMLLAYLMTFLALDSQILLFLGL
jgi:membrane-associated phospholipid phosphatase